MTLSIKEREKRVLECLDQNKNYREIQALFHISSREISFIAKKAKAKKEKEEETKLQRSLTSKAYKLYSKRKDPLYVATTLGIVAQEAKKLYMDYLELKGCHHIVEVLQQFDRQTIRNFSKSYTTNDNRIDEKKLIEAIKISPNLPKIKEEYNIILPILQDLRNQRNYYNSENKLLISKNLELQEGLSFARNRTKEYITELLKQKEPYIRASIMTIIKIIKEDPEKKILINNNNNNVHSSDQIISEMVAKFYDTISETIVLSITHLTNNNYDRYNNQEKNII
jgi:hypothetical protein